MHTSRSGLTRPGRRPAPPAPRPPGSQPPAARSLQPQAGARDTRVSGGPGRLVLLPCSGTGRRVQLRAAPGAPCLTACGTETLPLLLRTDPLLSGWTRLPRGRPALCRVPLSQGLSHAGGGHATLPPARSLRAHRPRWHRGHQDLKVRWDSNEAPEAAETRVHQVEENRFS